MLITRKLVSQRLARLLANVFWTAKMTVPAKLAVFQLLKASILNVHVRFVEVVTSIFQIDAIYFEGQLPTRMSM